MLCLKRIPIGRTLAIRNMWCFLVLEVRDQYCGILQVYVGEGPQGPETVHT